MAQTPSGQKPAPTSTVRPGTGFRPAAKQAAPAPEADYGQDALKLVEMFSGLLCGLIPAAESLWTEETRNNIAQVLKPVMEKHGWTLESLPPEIKLLLVAGPTLLQSGKLANPQAAIPPTPQMNRRADDHNGPADRRHQSDRRRSDTDRRAGSAQNLVRLYRWNQFKP